MHNPLDKLLDQENPKSRVYWNKLWNKHREPGGLVFYPLLSFLTGRAQRVVQVAWVDQLPVQDTDMQGVVVQGEAHVVSCEVLPDIEVVEIEDPSTGDVVLVQV